MTASVVASIRAVGGALLPWVIAAAVLALDLRASAAADWIGFDFKICAGWSGVRGSDLAIVLVCTGSSIVLLGLVPRLPLPLGPQVFALAALAVCSLVPLALASGLTIFGVAVYSETPSTVPATTCGSSLWPTLLRTSPAVVPPLLVTAVSALAAATAVRRAVRSG